MVKYWILTTDPTRAVASVLVCARCHIRGCHLTQGICSQVYLHTVELVLVYTVYPCISYGYRYMVYTIYIYSYIYTVYILTCIVYISELI